MDMSGVHVANFHSLVFDPSFGILFPPYNPSAKGLNYYF